MISENTKIRRLTIFLLKIALEFNKRTQKSGRPEKLPSIYRPLSMLVDS